MEGIEALLQYGIAMVVGLWLATFVGVLCHEGAHALAALAVGFRVHSIVVGRKPWLLQSDRSRVAIDLGLLPAGGFVRCGTSNAAWFRTRWCAVIVAGPLADLLLLFALLLLADAADGTESTIATVLGIVLLVHAASFIGRLWPREIRGLGPNDTLHVWRMLRMSAASVKEHCRQERSFAAALDAWHAFRRDEPTRALAQWDAGVVNDRESFTPGRSLYVWAAHGAEAALEALERERDELRAAMPTPRGVDPSVRRSRQAQAASARAVLYINEAFYCVEVGGALHLARAKWCMHLARTRLPAYAATLRTLGLVQIHCGDLDRGMANLGKALNSSDLHWGRALSACYLAFGHALRGDANRAYEYLDRAARLDPGNRLLPPYREKVSNALQRTS